MPKKKNKDDFNQIPKPISVQKPGDFLSQGRRRKLLDIPGNACDVEISELTNLNIFKEKGRTQGEIVTYSPENTYNYLSQSQRWDRSINLIPAYVNDYPDKIVYGFCSHGSPVGFWEVTISKGNIATYLEINPTVLVILCPRPFNVEEFATIDTDSTVFKYTQTAGNRTVLIEPDNIRNPLITIQSACYTDTCDSGSISPLIIRVETDNPLVFDDLVILNRPIENWDGQGYTGVVETDIEARKVKRFYRVPDNIQRAYEWLGTPLLVTWNKPVVDSEFISEYRVQILIPPYTDDQTFLPTDNRKSLLQANQRYRVASDFNIFGSQVTSYSDPVFFFYPILNLKTVFADDSDNPLGYTNISTTYETVTLDVKVVGESDDNDVGLGFVFIENAYDTIQLAVVVINESDDNELGIGYTINTNSYHKVDLGGVIIG